MNFEERVERIVSANLEHQLSLMQEAGDRTSDLLDRLNDIHRILPLIRDIKSEVSQIQKELSVQGDEKDDDHQKPNDGTDNDHELDPDTIKRYEELIRDINKILNDSSKAKRYLLPNSGKGPLNNLDDNLFKILSTLYVLSRDFNQSIKRGLERAGDVRIQDKTYETVRRLDSGIKNMETSITSAFDSLSSQLEECCNNMSNSLTQCCEAMSDNFSSVKDKLEDIDGKINSTTAGPNLSLENRAKDILGGLNYLRGLL